MDEACTRSSSEKPRLVLIVTTATTLTGNVLLRRWSFSSFQHPEAAPTDLLTFTIYRRVNVDVGFYFNTGRRA